MLQNVEVLMPDLLVGGILVGAATVGVVGWSKWGE